MPAASSNYRGQRTHGASPPGVRGFQPALRLRKQGVQGSSRHMCRHRHVHIDIHTQKHCLRAHLYQRCVYMCIYILICTPVSHMYACKYPSCAQHIFMCTSALCEHPGPQTKKQKGDHWHPKRAVGTGSFQENSMTAGSEGLKAWAFSSKP